MYELKTTLDRVKLVREASTVSRCHAVPHFGDYPVGLHTFNMLAMLRLLHPDPPIRLVWAILEHDVPERLTGDIPSPAKWCGIVDRDKLVEAETEINACVFGYSAKRQITQEEEKWLKGLDILELYMWCRDQEMLGNKNVRAMSNRINKFIKGNTHLFAKEVVNFYWGCYNSVWEMCPDLGDTE